MRILTDEGQAIEELLALVEGNTAPVLTPEELLRCLDNARLAFLWTASENFATAPRCLGSVAQPTATNRNGHRYKLTSFDGTGTTGGSTEPSWPTGFREIVTDGNLTWTEDGSDYQQLWDMNDAASRAWSLKKGKVATCTDFRQDGVGFSASQVFDHCLEMARFYQSVQIA